MPHARRAIREGVLMLEEWVRGGSLPFTNLHIWIFKEGAKYCTCHNNNYHLEFYKDLHPILPTSGIVPGEKILEKHFKMWSTYPWIF